MRAKDFIPLLVLISVINTFTTVRGENAGKSDPKLPMYAPKIKTLPDIFIGDEEENTCDVDNNFFCFSSAFLLDDYVSDMDTPTTVLKWAFREPGGAQRLRINNVRGLTSPFVTVWDIIASDIRQYIVNPRGEVHFLDYYHTYISPPVEKPCCTTPSVILNYTGENAVWLYCTDGTFITTAPLNIVTVDCGFDNIAFPERWNEIANYPFDTTEGWEFFSVGATFPTTFWGATSCISQGTLCIDFSNSRWEFGYWTMKSSVSGLLTDTNKLYRFTYRIVSEWDSTKIDRVPVIRLRAFSSVNDNEHIDYQSQLTINSKYPFTFAPDSEGREYNLYLKPTYDGGVLKASFDAYNMGGSVGSEYGRVYLDELIVSETEEPLEGWSVADTNDLSFERWTFKSYPAFFREPNAYSASPTGISFTVSDVKITRLIYGRYGQYYLNDAINFEDSPKLYKVVFRLTSSQPEESSGPPETRLFILTADCQGVFLFDRLGNEVPGEDGKVYSLFFEVPKWKNGGIVFEPVSADIAFDVLGFMPDELGTVTLTEITIYYHDLL
ncbi:hypothetical protein J7M23_05750 [Candidatus Sumerlaeota bacterium]|nr:hypothetical protein [Candidatus Sumerlaeota bacterium]